MASLSRSLPLRVKLRLSRFFEQAGQALGVGIAAMAHMFDIDLYIIGGSVAKSGDLLLDPTRRAVRYRAFSSIGPRVNVLASSLGDEANILGSAWVARQAMPRS